MDDYEEPARQRPVLDIELSGGLDEFIRVPRNLNDNGQNTEQDTFSTFGYDDKQFMRDSITDMSIYASVAKHENSVFSNIGKTSLSREMALGMAEAKKKMIRREFHLGEMHDGVIDDMIVKGENVLQREIRCAREIPEDERVMVRKDSSLFDL